MGEAVDDVIYCVGVKWRYPEYNAHKLVRFSYVDKSWRTKAGCQKYIDDYLAPIHKRAVNLSDWQPIKYIRDLDQ